MKILYLSASTIPSEYASSVHVMKMCNALAQNKHKVTLIASGENNGVDCFDYYNVNKIFDLRLCRRSPKKLSSILRLLDGIICARKNDIVYTRWIAGALILLMFSNKDIIFEYHGLPSSRLQLMLEKQFIRNKRIVRHIFIRLVVQSS